MSEDFTKPSDELLRVAEEINLLRRELQTASAALIRIEKRLRLAFPSYPKPKIKKKNLSSSETPKSMKSRDELLEYFEKILASTKQNGDLGFSSEINKLLDEDVISLAYELGVSNSQRISLKKAHDGIRKRIQESLLLSYESQKDNQDNSP